MDTVHNQPPRLSFKFPLVADSEQSLLESAASLLWFPQPDNRLGIRDLISNHLIMVCRLIIIILCAPVLLTSSANSQTVKVGNPDSICKNCHEQIYARYEQTPMAQASGNAADGLLPGAFFHKPSGIEYRLFLRNNHAWLSYDRPGSIGINSLHGEQQLMYYIGSGNRGRTYLFQHDGFWFESPVNWYSKKHVWDMNPKSLEAKEMPFTLPVDSTCLHCHSSGAAASMPGSRNHFENAPFANGGITCESCHGDPSAHLAQNGHGPILNPSHLTASRKDSICLQCHLEGETAVNQPGRSLQDFRPGDDLADDVRFFVHNGEIGANGRATSQWEALLQSACYRRSAGKMTCTTCHDPHGGPAPEERIAYYRSKCLACHSNPGFAERHHPEQKDCVSCHMESEKSKNIAHVQVTDHFIQKHPSLPSYTTSPLNDQLVAVGGKATTDRNLGLAYAQMVIKGNSGGMEQGRDLLQQAEKQEKKSGTLEQDADLYTNLAFLDLLSNDLSAATREYEAALHIEPENSIAAADLGVIEARSHQLTEAVQLWRMVSRNDPGHIAAGYNLAMGTCMLGDTKSAIDAINRVIAFSPDDAQAKKLLFELQARPDACNSLSRKHASR